MLTVALTCGQCGATIVDDPFFWCLRTVHTSSLAWSFFLVGDFLLPPGLMVDLGIWLTTTDWSGSLSAEVCGLSKVTLSDLANVSE